MDIGIIGSGAAGLTAAVYARRAGLDAAVFERGIYGGQIAITNEVENYPAVERITGAELAMQLYQQAKALGAEIVQTEITSIEKKASGFLLTCGSGSYEAKTVIFAGGAKRRALGCPGEEEFSGRGVSYCATCDGAFFKGKPVAVIGGGNTALEDALYLSKLCDAVHVIHRRDTFRGEKRLLDSVVSRPNVMLRTNRVVREIIGNDQVTGLFLRKTEEAGEEFLPISGVFVAIGYEPDNGILSGLAATDAAGYILAGEDCLTSCPGLFAAGDCRAKPLRQIFTAAADGAVAAFQAGQYLTQLPTSF